MKTPKLFTFSALLVFALGASACASIKQSVVFTPIDRALPVSASAALLVESRTYLPGDYELVDTFSFERTLRQPISGKDLLPLDLNVELAALRTSNGGDAIVNLRFHLLGVNTTSIDYIAIERFVGILGLGVMAVGALETSSESEGSASMTGTIMTGGAIAAIGFGGAQLHKAFGTIKYHYQVEGDIVRFR